MTQTLAPTMATFEPAKDRAAWSKARSTGLGGSDVAAAAGLNPYTSPYALWVHKIDPETDQTVENEAMEWGTRLEGVVLDKWGEQHPDLTVTRCPDGLWRHVEHDWMLATPDAIVVDETGAVVGIVECKTAGLRSAHQWDDGVPDHYELQTRWYMACLGAPRAWVAVLVGGQEWREYELVRDLDIEAKIIELAGGFWQLVVDRTSPAVDGHESTSEALRCLFDHDDGGSVELPSDGPQLIAEAFAARAEVKAAKERQDTIDNQLKALIGDNALATIGGEMAATWKTFDKKSFDKKAFDAAHPELAAQFTGTSTYRTLNLKGKTK